MLSALYARKKHNDEGFTLIELLVVVIIIGILAAIALPIFIDQQKAAVDASVASDVRNTVTNITSAQGVSNPSAKLVKSRSDTSVKVFEGTSTDADVETDGSISTPVLGTTYKVEGKNAGGKKYASQVYQFDSATGKFGAFDATVPAGVVVRSFNFDDGTAQGFTLGNSPGTMSVDSIAGHPAALHFTRPAWAGQQQNVTGPFNFSYVFTSGKTYKLSAMIYIDPSTTVTLGRMMWTNGGDYPTDLSTIPTGSWQKITQTVTGNGGFMYPYVWFNGGTGGVDAAIDDVTITQMN